MPVVYDNIPSAESLKNEPVINQIHYDFFESLLAEFIHENASDILAGHTISFQMDGTSMRPVDIIMGVIWSNLQEKMIQRLHELGYSAVPTSNPEYIGLDITILSGS